MAKRLIENFSFSDNDLQSFVKQYKVIAAKEMVPSSLHAVDEKYVDYSKPDSKMSKALISPFTGCT